MYGTLGKFKYLLWFETVHGLSVVSLSDLVRSSWKVVYTSGLIVFVSVVGFHSLYTWIISPIGYPATPAVICHVVVTLAMRLFILARAIYDYKTKVGTILSLSVLEDMANYEQGQTWKLFLLPPIIIYGFEIMSIIWSSYPFFEAFFALEMHYRGVKLSMNIGLLGFLEKILAIKREVNDQIEKVIGMDNEEELVSCEDRCKLLKKLKCVQISLLHIRDDIRSYYWSFIVWFVVSSAAVAPGVIYRYLTKILNGSPIEIVKLTFSFWFTGYLSYITPVILLIALESSNGLETSRTYQIQRRLMYSHKKKTRRLVKNSMLRHLHQAKKMDCVVIDIDWALLLAIVDTALMSACAMGLP